MDNSNIIAKLILSTKRKKRKYDLVSVNENIKVLLNSRKSKTDIANIWGISSGMLNQFLSVENVSSELRKKIENREIDSVSQVHMISKFPQHEQMFIADSIINDGISTADIRALLPLRRKFPRQNIPELLSKLLKSKDKKLSVVKIPKESIKLNKLDIENRFKKIIGSKESIVIEEDSEYLIFKFSKKGERKLKQFSRSQGNTLTKQIQDIII